MKQEGLRERVELLEIGEKLGYPRLGYGRPTKVPHDKRIPPGQVGWEKFCAHAHVKRVVVALRISRVLRDNNVTVFHPLSGAETVPPIDLLADFEETVTPQDSTDGDTEKPEAVTVPSASGIDSTPPLVPLKKRNAKNRGSRLKPSRKNRARLGQSYV